VVPRDALGSPALIEGSSNLGPFRGLEQLTIDGWQPLPGGGSLPSSLTRTEWRQDYGKPQRELSTTVYRDITVAPATGAIDPGDLETPLAPLLR
ncbi:MAG: hypothetical protein K8H90_08015, partial [Thermoanaerobaculia bacterium]|nr:hypothetical protein [Thermoanaerobaculia bacterium]